MEPQCFLCKYWDINFSLEVEDLADCDSSFAFVVWEVEPIFLNQLITLLDSTENHSSSAWLFWCPSNA